MYTSGDREDSLIFSDYKWKRYVGEDAFTVIFSNEHIGISTDADGYPTSDQTQTSHIIIYHGTSAYTDYRIGSITSPTYVQTTVVDDLITMRILQGVQIADDSGSITIPIIIDGETYNKQISFTVSKQGARGDEGYSYTIQLTNEAVSFTGNKEHAYADTAETGIIAYMNATQLSTRVTKIGTSTISDTSLVETGITGLKAKVVDNNTRNTVVQFQASTQLTQETGSIPITMTVDGKIFEKSFSYSIAFEGADGSPARVYILKSSDSAVKKLDSKISPITFTSWYREGQSTTEVAWSTHFRIEETYDESTWVTVYESNQDETEVTLYTDVYWVTEDGYFMTDDNGNFIITERRAPSSIRATIYFDDNFQNPVDTQTIIVVPDLEPELRRLEAKIGDVEFKVDSTEQKIESRIWETDITRLIDENNEVISEEIDTKINETVDTLDGRITTVSNRVTTQDGQITTLNTKTTTAQQTANMIKWLVNVNGKDATTFTLTERMAQLTADTVDISATNLINIISESDLKLQAKNINLTGAVTYSSLSTDAINGIRINIVNPQLKDYYIEASSNTVSVGAYGIITPNVVTFTAYSNVSGTQSTYSGRFIISETYDGVTWTTVYRSSQNETSVNYHYRLALGTEGGKAFVTNDEKVIMSIAKRPLEVKCELYATGSTTEKLAYSKVVTVTDSADVYGFIQESIDLGTRNELILADWCFENDTTYINGGKIYAGTITAKQITTDNIVGANGWINLRNGTFNYGNGNLSWDGQSLLVHGAITATSLTLEPDVKLEVGNIEGLADVAITGKYDSLLNKPQIPSSISDLSGSDKIMYDGDVSVVETTDSKGRKTTITSINGVTHTTITSTDGKYVLTDIGLGNVTSAGDVIDGQTGIIISTDGLLKASNAIIYGTIYANAGRFSGEITATKLTLGSGVKISTNDINGLKTVATTGDYSDLSNKPSIPSQLSDLTDGANVLHNNDVTISESTNESTGIKTTTTTYGGKTYTTYTSTASGGYLLTNIGKGTASSDHTKSYFMVNTDGLLTANNALIYGTIYATAGEIGGCSISNGVLQIGAVNIGSGVIPADKLESTVQTKIDNGNSAKTTLDSNASKWNSTSTTVTNNQASWNAGGTAGTWVTNNGTPAYNMLKSWAYGDAISSTTKIDGGLLQTDTVLANAIYVTTLSTLTANVGTLTAGIIQSSDYSYTSGNYSTSGFAIDLTNRFIRAKNFYINASGSAYFNGTLYSTAGEIGGFQIDTTSIHTKNVAITSNAENSVALASSNFTRTVAGVSVDTLRFAIGANFGVTNTGKLYASDGVFSGNIDATTIKAKNEYDIYAEDSASSTKTEAFPFIKAGIQNFTNYRTITLRSGFDLSECSIDFQKSEDYSGNIIDTTILMSADTVTIMGGTGSSSKIDIIGNLYVNDRYVEEWMHDKSGNGIRIYTDSSTTTISPVLSFSMSGATGTVNLGRNGDKFNSVYATNGTIQTSDRNLKEDFREFTEEHEKAYMELKPLRYRLKNITENDNHDRTHYGLIAQDAEETMNKYGFSIDDTGFLCKGFDDDGNETYSMRYTELVSLNMHMIQKVIKRVDELEMENRALKQIVLNILK